MDVYKNTYRPTCIYIKIFQCKHLSQSDNHLQITLFFFIVCSPQICLLSVTSISFGDIGQIFQPFTVLQCAAYSSFK